MKPLNLDMLIEKIHADYPALVVDETSHISWMRSSSALCNEFYEVTLYAKLRADLEIKNGFTFEYFPRVDHLSLKTSSVSQMREMAILSAEYWCPAEQNWSVSVLAYRNDERAVRAVRAELTRCEDIVTLTCDDWNNSEELNISIPFKELFVAAGGSLGLGVPSDYVFSLWLGSTSISISPSLIIDQTFQGAGAAACIKKRFTPQACRLMQYHLGEYS